MIDRRLAMAYCALVGLVGLLALGHATTAYAHGDTIRLTVTGVTAGHSQFTATWENDKDPVDERIAGTMSATAADGTTVGPWRLIPVPGHTGSLTTNEVLPPGRWDITAETAFPALGRGAGTADVPVVDPGPFPTPSGAVTGGPGVVTDPVPAGTAAATASGATAPTGSPAGPSTPTAAPASSQTVPSDDRSSDGQRAITAIGVAAVSVAAVAVAVKFLRRSIRP
ncbi:MULTISPECIES: hypothetical protein [unclassified Kitasatospora]|uniref:hypothetical protein n=1 Tax=unclassified Kitasatospora TaxID=2633591 RepID=UPI0007108A08|nr:MULTISPECIES: hypothetical protein [unclassified Kitasatospora]KQV18325.1 hypothetical protein ASC99_03545 [Kitasatospora sp. Root107]KRB74310.1 hypothetical protein ASE03_17455 [Kitasatospora sp. Root187]